MNYADSTLLRMADPTTRSGLFDAIALEQMVRAAYDAETMNVEGPFQPVFEEFRLGFPVPRLAAVEGFWNRAGGADRTEARFQLSGLGNDSPLRVDALWRGSIVAHVAVDTGRVIELETAWPNPGTIDAEIEAALGSLPANPQLLEQERRSRFLARLRAAMQQPGLFTEDTFDRWLRSVGAVSVSDLMARYQGTVGTGMLQITFSAPQPGPTYPKLLPIAAALLIRDAGFSVGALLMESKVVRQQMEAVGLERVVDPSLRLRHPLLVVWVVPETVFEDADWPGAPPGATGAAARDARRAMAGTLLGREGIGLVVTP